MKKSMCLILVAVLFSLPAVLPFPAWAQKSDKAQVQTEKDKDALIKKLKAENLKLRQKVLKLIDQNNFLNENLMNCMEDLNSKDLKTEKE